MQRITLRSAALGAVLLTAAAMLLLWVTHLGHPDMNARADEKSVNDSMALPKPAPDTRKVKFYRNPMGLPDISPSPKKDSMGMDYIPVYEGEEHDGNSISVSPGKVQRSGVETVAAVKQSMTRTIKAPGVIQLDERRISVIAPRFDGYVESVGPATTGTHVKKGDPLVTVFGQEVQNQGVRLIIEQNAGGRGDEATALSNGKFAPGGVIGARRRLVNLGVPVEYIETVIRERRVPDTLTFRGAGDGVILERNVVEGQAFKAGDVLFRLADHSQVWMMADIAEGDIDAVSAGQTAIIKTRAHPGKQFIGKVAVVYPHLTKETRTARVRIELPNSDLALLPDMYGDVEIATGAAAMAVAVPASAVIDSGNRQVVILDLGDGRFEPRDVKLGRKGDGFTEILDGVAEGEKVVVNGNFLIDAESNLQSALKTFSAPSVPEAKP
ncbi:efflux RND transporter periplasmic adaptor subunit [Hyphomicrobium sp. 2TAF46]|uniref:efflux RND transporter periplasmic adaptor subunit n=1 Tax=Hyphomicrobium sp. 2TAF46 TaxID=3233019 RepID=UPI003F8E6D2F